METESVKTAVALEIITDCVRDNLLPALCSLPIHAFNQLEPAPEPTLLEAAERVVWGIYRNGKLADVALTRSAMEYETEYAIGYRSNTAQAMLLCKASPEQIAAVELAKGGG